jgi:protein-S-isoprenylcysteine O-methyltransferase Ste14
MQETGAAPAAARDNLGSVLGWLLSTTALAGASGVFAWAHWVYWRRTGDPKGAVFAVEELVVVAVAIIRRRPTVVSRRLADWAFAFVGSYAVLALRPGSSALFGAGYAWIGLQCLGACIAISGLICLGGGFGIVPAHRKLQRSGPYRFVRHPLYAAYTLMTLGYVLASPTAWNIVIFGGVLGAQLRRIDAEERVLDTVADYRSYATAVPYRMVPGLY